MPHFFRWTRREPSPATGCTPESRDRTPRSRSRLGGKAPPGGFETYFRLYGQRFFGVNFSECYFKAQAIAESRLRTDARSPEGAVGVMQRLPRTLREIADEVSHIRPDIQNPRWNIAAGIYCDRKL
ncbi:MAG: transglycosylase SLT domain-containing protein [Desulfobacteraceae bacterium]